MNSSGTPRGSVSFGTQRDDVSTGISEAQVQTESVIKPAQSLVTQSMRGETDSAKIDGAHLFCLCHAQLKPALLFGQADVESESSLAPGGHGDDRHDSPTESLHRPIRPIIGDDDGRPDLVLFLPHGIRQINPDD